MGFGGRTPKQRTQRGKVELYESETSLPFLWVEVNQVFSRGDIGYWNTRWVELEAQLRKCPYPLKKLGEFIPETVERDGTEVPGITYGQVGRREYPPAGTTIQQVNGSVRLLLPGTRRKEEREGVLYLQVRNLRRTGIDHYETPLEKRFIEAGSYNDLLRSRVAVGDLLIVNSGIGSLGRCAVLTDQFPLQPINISQDITRIILQKIAPEWVAIYLQTEWGANQIVRYASGVSGQIKIDFGELRSILIAVPRAPVQQVFQQAYRQMVGYHLKSLEAKRDNRPAEAERYQQIALGMLESLIWQAERAIRDKSFQPLLLIPADLPESLVKLLEDEYARIGEIAEQVDIRPQHAEFKARPLGIPLERDAQITTEVERLMRWVRGFKEFRDAATR